MSSMEEGGSVDASSIETKAGCFDSKKVEKPIDKRRLVDRQKTFL